MKTRILQILCFAVCALSVSPTAHAAARTPDLTRESDDWFRSAEGSNTRDCLLSWQSEHGDGPKNKDTTSQKNSGSRAKIEGSFDNSATTTELRILAHAFKATGAARYEQAFLAGFEHILKGAVQAGVAGFASAKVTGFRYVKRQLIPDASAPPIWARFYEIESNRPFFSDRDGVLKYNLSEIGSERRNGYNWYNTAGEAVAKAYAQWPQRSPKQAASAVNASPAAQ